MRGTLLLLAVGVTGCFSPKFEEAQYTCPTTTLCPPGFTCGPDRVCHRPENLPDLGVVPFVGNGMLGDHVFNEGKLIFDTKMGQISLVLPGDMGDITTIVVPKNSPGFIPPQDQPNGGPQVSLFQFNNLTIGPAATITQSGSTPFAIVVKDTLTLDGTIDLRVNGGGRGLAGQDGNSGTATPNGGGGKASTVPGRGGGGAGHNRNGDPGPMGGGAGGGIYGNTEMTSLQIGSGGGGGLGPGAGAGGTGAGGIALLGNRLAIRGTIDVSGSRPSDADQTSASACGGGGGGSGGSIMISAIQLTWAKSARLKATGGDPGEGGGPTGDKGTKGGKGSEGRIWRVKDKLSFEGGITSEQEVLSDPPLSFSTTPPLSAFPRPMQ